MLQIARFTSPRIIHEAVSYDERNINEVGAIEYAKQALPIVSQEVINAN